MIFYTGTYVLTVPTAECVTLGVLVDTPRFLANGQSLQQTWRAQRALVHKNAHKNWLLAVARKCNLLPFTPFTPVARTAPPRTPLPTRLNSPGRLFLYFLLYLRRTRCERTDDANIKHETGRPDYKLIIFNKQP